MSVTQYIGSRYVPIFADPLEWDNEREYEPLTIVTHDEHTYTSKQAVPVGIAISNGDYWVMTGTSHSDSTAYQALTLAQQVADKFPVAIADGGTGSTTAAAAASAIVDGQDIAPANVTASDDVSAANVTASGDVADGVGTLGDLREYVAQTTLTATWTSNVKSQGFRRVVRMGNLVFFGFSCNVNSANGPVLTLPVTLAAAFGILSHQADENIQGIVEADGNNLVVNAKSANWMIGVGWGIIA